MRDIWAVVPMKDTACSKQRLAGAYAPSVRQRLAIAMFEDVMTALCASAGLAGILVVSEDLEVAAIARRCGARVVDQGAREGHTGAVLGGGRVLSAEGRAGMLAVPGDIPLVSSADMEALLAAHGEAPCFTIVPAHDRLGSNAVVLSPPDVVPLRFGGESFGPHLVAAAALGVRCRVVELPRVGLDIDEPMDVERFLQTAVHGRAWTFLKEVCADTNG